MASLTRPSGNIPARNVRAFPPVRPGEIFCSCCRPCLTRPGTREIRRGQPVPQLLFRKREERGGKRVQVQALSLPLYMLVYTFKSYLMGIGRKQAANLFSVLSECVIHVLSVYLMVFVLGGRGAWAATPVKLMILLLGAVGYVILSGRGKSFREKCLLLPPGFLHPENQEMSGSVPDMEGVMTVAQASQRFCTKNGLDEKTANSLMLCIEEMGAMIIRHGFHDGKMHSIDIRILIRPDKLILRIRDDCQPFDPVECYEMIKDKDSDDKTGMQIILAMSENIQYMSSVGTNNLMITLGRTRGSIRNSAGGIRHEVRQSLRQAPL